MELSESIPSLERLLSKEERSKIQSEAQRKYFDSLSEEEREALRDRKSQSVKAWWKSLSPEEAKRISKLRSDNTKAMWANLSEEERERISTQISIGRKEWWDSLSPEELEEIGARHKKEFWDKRTPKEYHQSCLEAARRANANQDEIIINNKCELLVLEALKNHKLPFRVQWYNTTKHDSFDELFKVNPATDSIFVSPYHSWDFIIHTTDGNVLVDVDGPIHSYPFPFPVTYLNRSVDANDMIAFNDSKRPYQTDGLPAYIIQCPDDTVDDMSIVRNVDTGEEMPLKAFLSLLSFMNMSKKDQRQLVKMHK